MRINTEALFSYLTDDLSEVVSPYHLHVCDRSGTDDYWPGATATQVAALRLRRSLLKKLRDDEKVDAKQKCLEKFLASDKRCEQWQYDPKSAADEELFGLFKQEVDNFLHPRGEPLVQSYFDILNRGRAGPGASVGANGPDFYTKFFSSNLTCTSSELYKMYNEYVGWDSNWVDAEISRSLNLGTFDVVPGSHLSFVRKNVDIARSICTEPSLNMFYQLGLGQILTDRLGVEFNIDIGTQPEWNRSMACWGSQHPAGSTLVTIDLESASDSVSCNLCEAVLPEWFKTILWQIRSPRVKINGMWMRLNMISSMGNGFTFPLQTMFFACAVRAALVSLGIPPLPANQELVDVYENLGGEAFASKRATWGVFGDDIICHSDVARRVVGLLQLLGFTVNPTKSYFEGPFRESCGADYYDGQLVRGVYIKTLKTQQGRYVAINRLNEWSAVTGIHLPRTVGYLRDSVQDLAVPYWESDDAGIRTLSPPLPKYDENNSFLYRKFVPVSPELEIGDDSVTPIHFTGQPPKKRIYNPSGLLCSFYAGYVRNCHVTLALKQGDSPRYRTTCAVTPNWCHMRKGTGFAADPAFWTPRIRAALEANLIS